MSWSLCGPQVSIGWVKRDLLVEEVDGPAEDASICGGTVLTTRDTTGNVIVCNASKRRTAITMYYPPQLASFFTDRSLLGAFEPGGFLGSKLAADVGEIRFLEWRQGSVRVPCLLPTWMAFMLWDLVRCGDKELLGAMCGDGPHVLRALEMDGWSIGKELAALPASIPAAPSSQPVLTQGLQQLSIASDGSRAPLPQPGAHTHLVPGDAHRAFGSHAEPSSAAPLHSDGRREQGMACGIRERDRILAFLAPVSSAVRSSMHGCVVAGQPALALTTCAV